MQAADDSKKQLFVWDVGTGRPKYTVDCNAVVESKGISIRLIEQFGASDELYLSCADTTKNYNGYFVLWNLESNEPKKLLTDWHEGASAMSPDQKYLAKRDTNTVQMQGHPVHVHGMSIWDLETGRKLGRFEGHWANISSLSFTPDGRTLISSAYDGTVKFWDTNALAAKTK